MVCYGYRQIRGRAASADPTDEDMRRGELALEARHIRHTAGCRPDAIPRVCNLYPCVVRARCGMRREAPKVPPSPAAASRRREEKA